MSNYIRYAYLLSLEADRHLKLASVATEPLVRLSHIEVAKAQMKGAILLRREARKKWRSCPKLDQKRRLSLKPLRPA